MANLRNLFGQFVKEGTHADLISEKELEVVKEHIKHVFRTDVRKELKKKFLEAYDELAEKEASEQGGAIRGKDPTLLHYWRDLFARQLDTDLAEVEFDGDNIIINVGRKDFLGYSGGGGKAREGPPEYVDWLVFYIEGIVGEYAFITPEQYKSRGRRSSKPLGRFGLGFMISKERYISERWEEVTGLPFSQVKHPISGQKPTSIFEEVPKNFDFGKYVQKALSEAVKDLG